MELHVFEKYHAVRQSIVVGYFGAEVADSAPQPRAAPGGIADLKSGRIQRQACIAGQEADQGPDREKRENDNCEAGVDAHET